MPIEGVLLSGLHSPPDGAGPLMMRASLSLMAPESGQARQRDLGHSCWSMPRGQAVHPSSLELISRTEAEEETGSSGPSAKSEMM